jgi:predicted enzyme related to lactoylglutathione lyase
MDMISNSLNWFEIPVSDMIRAKHFYQVIFSMHMEEDEIAGVSMAYFPFEPGSGKVSGALAKSDLHIPSPNGPVIYLNGNPDLTQVLEKVEPMGGQIITPKTLVTPGIGYIAGFKDTEGNHIALHSLE